MRLYTKGGDKGETGLIGGGRVPKDHPRIAAYGDMDELNAAIGLVRAACDDEAWCDRMQRIQECLFVLGASVMNVGRDQRAPCLTEDDVSVLERWIDSADESVEPLKHFVLPGGSEAAARLHLARTICRRAERGVVALSREESVAPIAMVYLNRLSDLLFAWARLANARAGVGDELWDGSPSA
jgi:cob(I)alamin adenosyltransferase